MQNGSLWGDYRQILGKVGRCSAVIAGRDVNRSAKGVLSQGHDRLRPGARLFQATLTVVRPATPAPEVLIFWLISMSATPDPQIGALFPGTRQ